MSWGSPDRASAVALRDQLEELGLETWFCEHDIKPGKLHEQIAEGIDRAEHAIVCLSHETLNRPWIEEEVRLLRVCLEDDDIVPVWVGPADDDRDRYPIWLRERVPLNWHEDPDRTMRKLAGKLLPHSTVDVPAMLFAMTDQQWQDISASVTTNAAYNTLSAACAHLGLSLDSVVPSWNNRYGKTAHLFRPYGESALRDAIRTAIGQANQTRTKKGYPAVVLKWYEPEELNPQSTRQDWEGATPLVIIDTVSLLHPTVRQSILDMPKPDRGFAALVCIPPYSCHTAALDHPVTTSFEKTARIILDWLRQSMEGRGAAAWDVSTPQTFDAMLRRAVVLLDPSIYPLQRNVVAVAEAQQLPPTSLKGIHGVVSS